MTADERASFLAATTAGDAAPGGDVRTVLLASAIDFAGFRRACRVLWSEQVAPDRVVWQSADDAEGDLFESERAAAGAAGGQASAAPPVHVPAAFLPLAESAILHGDPERFGLLYRLLWRLQVEPGPRADPVDPDWLRADELAQAVRRDLHKMKAFVRFRTIAPPEPGAASLHVAWFEPEHHIVEAVAPFFARRFTVMHWAILTPERSVRWDGIALRFGPAARREEAPGADAGERLWLTYY